MIGGRASDGLVLTLNAGSSSRKLARFASDASSRLVARGPVAGLGTGPARMHGAQADMKPVTAATHADADDNAHPAHAAIIRAAVPSVTVRIIPANEEQVIADATCCVARLS